MQSTDGSVVVNTSLYLWCVGENPASWTLNLAFSFSVSASAMLVGEICSLLGSTPPAAHNSSCVLCIFAGSNKTNLAAKTELKAYFYLKSFA